MPKKSSQSPERAPRPWLASYPPGVPERYEYPLVPLTRLLDDAAKDFPHTAAVEFGGRSLTYRELLDAVDRFATALQHLGVGKGDRVCLALPSCPQHVVALFAVLRIGAVVTAAGPDLPGDDLRRVLNDAGCRVVVCLDTGYPKLARLKGRLERVEHIVATALRDYLPPVKGALLAVRERARGERYRVPPGEGVLAFRDLVARTAPSAAQAELDPGADLAALLYGDSRGGTSRGVMLTHLNLVASAFQARLWVPDVQAGRERVLCALPLHTAAGLTTALTLGVLSAATLVIPADGESRTLLRTIDKQSPTLFPGTPDLYEAVHGAPDAAKHDLSSIRVCLSSGPPLPATGARRLEELTGGKVRQVYGLAETSSLTHANPVYGRAKPGSVGLPVTDTACRLVDPDDPRADAPAGGPGELAVSGPQVMAGYWNDPEATDAVLHDGWLLTGDVATADDDGYFFVVNGKAPGR